MSAPTRSTITLTAICLLVLGCSDVHVRVPEEAPDISDTTEILRATILPEIHANQVPLDAFLRSLSAMSKARDPSGRGVKITLNPCAYKPVQTVDGRILPELAKKTVTVHAEGLSAEDVLGLVCTQNGLSYKVVPGGAVVSPL